MDTKRIQEILMSKDRRMKVIDQKMQILYKELENLEHSDELLSVAALPAIRLESSGGGGGVKKDNADILLRYYHQKDEQRKEIRAQMWQLSEEEAQIRRVWCCFQALDADHYLILYRLYVKRELFKTVEVTSGYNHSTFVRMRKYALERILWLYESKASNMELIEAMTTHRDDKGPIRKGSKKKAKQKEYTEEFEQLELQLAETETEWTKEETIHE